MPASEGHPLIAYQPFKLLFQLAYAGTVVARVPLWLVVALVRPLRPHPKWTVKQAFMARAAYVLQDVISRVGVTEKLSLQPGKEGNRFQVVKPSTSNNYIGPLASSVRPETIGGTWFPERPDAGISSKRVVYYIHGGAFVVGDGRDAFAGFAGNNMVQGKVADFVFSLQYRLSGWSGQSPFPAALQDALTGYLFLIRELGIPPQQVVVCGDSAGGNIVIALLRYIQEFGAELGIGQPRCAALVAPWVAPFDYVTEQARNRNSDFLPTSFLRWGAHTYAGSLPASNKYITPLGSPFTTPVPIFASAGTAEIFYDPVERWTEEMKQIEGNKVVFHAEDAALHDTFLLGDTLGFEESARDVIAAMRSFVDGA
ncbi:hypothetical protein JX265_005596 [Neoarthrinium moseri]|uniref:Alpha/beta hydrolase fold-3 domain-containing protein n=1 Tax=Neoarthrinium moseri TaxID=1658444 RepID=A0A9P9WMZ8_9PEZI|nr:uncharacterized protein JN550_008335 [Neoarthrinium moseri]KAI1865287.1 hypothetical protein JN550_008335 [Neoarthrinium moseri]KAI1871610.1 hypothetical protein JX265_005596 [Neoarthrinium moseri]